MLLLLLWGFYQYCNTFMKDPELLPRKRKSWNIQIVALNRKKINGNRQHFTKQSHISVGGKKVLTCIRVCQTCYIKAILTCHLLKVSSRAKWRGVYQWLHFRDWLSLKYSLYLIYLTHYIYKISVCGGVLILFTVQNIRHHLNWCYCLTVCIILGIFFLMTPTYIKTYTGMT